MQGALIRLESWSKNWCLPLNLIKCEVCFLSIHPHHTKLQPHLFSFHSPFHYDPIQGFLEVTFDCTLSFSKHVSLLKAKFFPGLKVYIVSVFPHGASKLQPHLFSFYSPFRFNPTQGFLEVTFDCTLSFSTHVSLLKAKLFPGLRALHCISVSSWGL